MKKRRKIVFALAVAAIVGGLGMLQVSRQEVAVWDASARVVAEKAGSLALYEVRRHEPSLDTAHFGLLLTTLGAFFVVLAWPSKDSAPDA